MTRYLRERQRKQPRETAETYDHYVNRGMVNPLIIIGPVNQKKNRRKIAINFLSISFNICLGCSIEPSH